MKRRREICILLLSGLHSNEPAGHGQEPGEIRAPFFKSFYPHLHLSSKLIKSLKQHSEQLLPQSRPQHSLWQLRHLHWHSLCTEVPSCPAPFSGDGSAHQDPPGCPQEQKTPHSSDSQHPGQQGQAVLLQHPRAPGVALPQHREWI